MSDSVEELLQSTEHSDSEKPSQSLQSCNGCHRGVSEVGGVSRDGGRTWWCPTCDPEAAAEREHVARLEAEHKAKRGIRL